jgi:hypothetical protein
MVRQKGRRYEVRLETPSISFAPHPDHPGDNSHEREYHASARRRFEEVLAPLKRTLDDAIDALLPDHPGVTLLPFERGKPHESSFVGCPPDLNIGFDHGTLSLAFGPPRDKDAEARLFAAIKGALWTILREDHLRKREARRRGPAPAEPTPFHYTRAADGTIADLTGEAPGRRVENGTLETCASVAAIIAITEDDGVVHAELDITNLRADGAELSIDRFGEVWSSDAGRAPEGGTSNLMLPPGRRLDWIARQRYSLGCVIYQLLAGKALEVPRGEADHDPAVARALAEIEPAAVRELLGKLLAFTPRKRPSARDAYAVLAANLAHSPPTRGVSRIAERRAADTRGVLVECWKCGRPALRHAGRSVRTGDSYRPDCCWAERDRRMLRIAGATVLAGLVALIWWIAS